MSNPQSIPSNPGTEASPPGIASSAQGPEAKATLRTEGDTPPTALASSAKGSSGVIVGMGSCYALGTFTDNFYKQAAILLAASAQMTWVQSFATVLFSLPFVLFSAWAGATADRIAKKNIVVAVKTLELTALLIGGYMLYTQNWVGMLVVMFLMGVQSAFFSPAINGSIPENFAPSLVPRANALIKLASTAAILAGIAAAGVVLDLRPGTGSLTGLLPDVIAFSGPVYGRVMAAAVVAVIAFIGLLTAFTLKKRSAALQSPGTPFPWAGPIDSLRQLIASRSDRSLFLVLVADAWFFGIAAIAVISIANITIVLGYSNTTAGIMSALLMIGVAIGSVIAGRFSAESWKRLLIPSGVGMAVMLLLVSLTPLFPGGDSVNPQLVWLGCCLCLCGICGGLYLIPLESFIQVRPAPEAKGRTIAISNFFSFLTMSIFGAAFQIIRFLPPALTFIVYGLSTLCFLFFLSKKMFPGIEKNGLKEDAQSLTGLLMKALLSLRYKVSDHGLERVAPLNPHKIGQEPGMLVLPNHPALIDPVIIYSRLAGLRLRPLADQAQMTGGPLQRAASRIIRAITIPDMDKSARSATPGVRKGLDAVVEALRNGDNVLLYPSGRAYRKAGEHIGNNAAVAYILAQLPQIRVLLVRSTGIWGSSFSYASGKTPEFIITLARGVRDLFANLLFFMPKREISLEYVEDPAFPRDADRVTLNRYLESFYNAKDDPALFVHRYFWEKNMPELAGNSNDLPNTPSSPQAALKSDETLESLAASFDETSIPMETKEVVYTLLREMANLPDDRALAPSESLSTDLYLDSLALMELSAALEANFGHAISSPELLVTVGDCLRAAVGRLQGEDDIPRPAPAEWFAYGETSEALQTLTLPEGARTFMGAFLALTKADPSAVMVADRSGVRSRKTLLVGVLALAVKLKTIPGERVGIMLPAAPAALMFWLATMLAGKEPVFINWTVGRRNMEHCLTLSGVSHVVTANALLEQLERTGLNIADIPAVWLRAEELGASLSKADKLRAAVLATLHCSPLPYSLTDKHVRDTAAILFTSGSEAAPKAVPLKHSNIMCNAADIIEVLKVKKGDRLLGMLPPFHSFGLLVGLALPAVTGIAVAYHANPTESAQLVGMVRDYGLTLLGATPTFLDGMIAKARVAHTPGQTPAQTQSNASPTSPLASLRYVFAGAEKCPQHVYDAFAAVCPEAILCEGYGITECSPVVAVNRPESVVSGSIGHALPAVETALVTGYDDASGASLRLAGQGERGMLLVRGESIFSGYLTLPGEQSTSPFILFEGKNWYKTGDLLTQDETGRLFFQGRLKRFVKIGGEMISLPQMEEILKLAFADKAEDNGKSFIAVEAKPGSEDQGEARLAAVTTLPLTILDVNTALRQAGLAPVYSVKDVLEVEELPLLGTGKVDYQALKSLLK